MKDFVKGKEIKRAGQGRDGSQWHPKRPFVLVFQGRTSGPGLRTSRTNTRTAPGKLGRVDQPSGSMPLRGAKGFAHPWELSPLLKDLSLPTHTCRAMGRTRSTYRGDHVPLLLA